MQNQPVIEKSRIGKNSRAQKKRPLADFLLDSNFPPLILLGKCVQQFGWKAVGGVLLGGLSVWGYAVVVKPLPYMKTEKQVIEVPAPGPTTKTVQLRGRVRDGKGSPVNERFWVGVLARQLGPVQNSDGTFALEVPQSSSYDVALWTTDTINIYNGFAAEQDGSGYRLLEALPFLSASNPAPLAHAGLRRRESPADAAPNQIAKNDKSSGGR
jgi:hypothetical protein